jgi:hypothetical protein
VGWVKCWVLSSTHYHLEQHDSHFRTTSTSYFELLNQFEQLRICFSSCIPWMKLLETSNLVSTRENSLPPSSPPQLKTRLVFEWLNRIEQFECCSVSFLLTAYVFFSANDTSYLSLVIFSAVDLQSLRSYLLSRKIQIFNQTWRMSSYDRSRKEIREAFLPFKTC